jgi:hypothetical protein
MSIDYLLPVKRQAVSYCMASAAAPLFFIIRLLSIPIFTHVSLVQALDFLWFSQLSSSLIWVCG